ncbi:hypothetical protein F2Q70_00026972 [Brassica cretica]|uniref:Uncharacterized protein n=1 Tax=Brassica cretica TaxID=69181 RepID=A0A8S9L4X6_BRACR|nr:hypothetical protein F2Q70_00026972 [Brassica cretica]
MLNVVNFRLPISGGISPESSFSDRSRSSKAGNNPRARGIFPESLFFDRLNVTSDFHEMISSGNSPERLFESRKRRSRRRIYCSERRTLRGKTK